ncbi:hypothetical protein QQP08_025045 [Theobroma cacao]|nr:hypothetical protein QQP08_025045 [Theobroma cacao]
MTTIQTHQTRNNHNYETHLKAVKITLAFLSSSAAPEGRLMLSMRIKEMPRNNRIPVEPSSVKSLASNAVTSLTRIIKRYDLDGIDIDYEHF